VTPAKNGPLLVQGNVEVVTGTGHTVNRVVKTALCRCGHSANKPYCDGTHAKVGFTSE
jgi:CDGSH-type Zn-finger protein